MTTPLVRNGWKIYYHPQFDQQFIELESEVIRLQTKLPEKEYLEHAVVKRYAALVTGIEQKIPSDPLASHFALKGPLRRYSRLKKMGLDSRYRLFFKVFSQQKIIIILWLGHPRRDGDPKDCNKVFTKKVSRGEFPDDIEQLIPGYEVQAEM